MNKKIELDRNRSTLKHGEEEEKEEEEDQEVAE
jgi:hypothetical protein